MQWLKRQVKNYEGLTPYFDACSYEFSASFCGKIYSENFSIAVDDGSKNDLKRLEISARIASLLHRIYMDCKENSGGSNDVCA